MLNDADLAVLAMLAAGTLFTTTIGFAVLWIRARERAYRASLEARQETRLADVEHPVNAIDSIAVEVERISEAQRFTVQALLEKGDGSVAKRFPERVITPH